MQKTMVWFGLVLTGAGLVVSVVAYNWDVAYGGPMTGLGPALVLLAAMGVVGLGVVVTLVSLILGAVAKARRERAPPTTPATERRR